MLNANINPKIIARIPIIILNAVNPEIIKAIPKKTKLTPMRTDNAAELKIGKIIKINPKITDSIPAILFDSIFFPPKILLLSTFSSEVKIKKAIAFLHL